MHTYIYREIKWFPISSTSVSLYVSLYSCVYIYMYTYPCLYLSIYTWIYNIYIERERERFKFRVFSSVDRDSPCILHLLHRWSFPFTLHPQTERNIWSIIHLNIYICIYIEREWATEIIYVIYISLSIYMYMYRERDGDRGSLFFLHLYIFVYIICVDRDDVINQVPLSISHPWTDRGFLSTLHLTINIYIYIFRERSRVRGSDSLFTRRLHIYIERYRSISYSTPMRR